MDDIDAISFWPSAEEFKDLLLDESRFRVEVAGDWMAPLGYNVIIMTVLSPIIMFHFIFS